MNINIEHVLRSWVLTAVFFLMSVLLFIFSIYFYKDSNERVADIVSEMTYMKDRQAFDEILSEGSKYLRITTMYSRIHAIYGNKYHKRYNKPGKYIHQGLKKEIRADFFRLCYEYSRILSIPYFDLIATTILETSMNPIARTFWENGRLKEAGIFQHRKSAVEHANWILHNVLPTNLRKIFNFKFESMRDLLDPINALKVASLLFWGAKSTYRGDPSWYVTSVHWGASRIAPYYYNGVLPPKKFVFNKGTINEDARSPFTYYFVWNAYKSQFEKFSTKVFIDKSWVENYKKACTKMEWQFIHSQKYVRQMINIAEDIRKSKIDFEKDYLKKNKKLEKKIRQTDKIYRELNGLIKRGKFKSIFKEVFYPGKLAFKELALNIRNKEISIVKKIILISFIFILLCTFTFAVIGVIYIGKKVHRKIKN